MPSIDTSRRDFMKGTGMAAVGAVLSTSLPGFASAQGAPVKFDIDNQFAEFMRGIGGTAADAGGKVEFHGSDPLLRSHFRIGACMAIPAMGAGVGAAAIWRQRTGEGQDLSVDLRQAVWNTNPLIGLVHEQLQAAGLIPASDPIPALLTSWKPKVNGLMVQAPVGLGNPLSFQAFETRDGRFINLTGIYPHLMDRILNVLKVPPNQAAIRAAVKKWDGQELEDTLAANNGVAALHRTHAEWLAHPQGKYLAGTPLIEIVKVGEAPPRPFTANPERPLSGKRVVSCTHVIAGTTAARTLAEYGANVLHIARDQSFEHEALVIDVNVGMRSAWVNLRNAEQNKRFGTLLPDADVFIEGFRGRSMERLGFGAEEVARRSPGIVYLSVRGYGWEGPWGDRAAFDMEGVSTTGFTLTEGGGTGVPRFPPTLVMNDYITGYIGAAGILAALRRQATEGGSWHVRVNLARAAMWFQDLGHFPDIRFDASRPENRMTPPEIMERQTPYGRVERLVPQVRLSKTPGRWRDPLVTVRGSDLPRWEG
ncbi:MAG: CoA transferase [Xanthomonadales bacterium]|nr:CoA transferase [Xanthomonadales bacterium]HRF83209.1 CoA transferase [Pseudoxanthomonas sp.]